MKILVLNCGSSSIKFQLIETSLRQIAENTERTLIRGLIEKIGMPSAVLSVAFQDGHTLKDAQPVADHTAALEWMLSTVLESRHGGIDGRGAVEAVGHRITHGGEYFTKSALIDEQALKHIEECIDLAPLHNPHNLRGYHSARQLFPGIPHCAVFDTSFHQSMPPRAFLYALPYVQYLNHKVRRYGFHGTSHRYLVYELHRRLGVPRDAVNAITLHLGNGCSIAAVAAGVSLDTSMGFTPLEGLIMGTRCGDVDPYLVLHLINKEELSLNDVNTMLNKYSGLLGLSGVSNDLREILKAAQAGNRQAEQTVEAFCYRVQKYIGAYMTVVGPRLHAIVFAGGIGENSPEIRQRIAAGLEIFNIALDPQLNQNAVSGVEACISTADSRFPVFVIPTNEELVIARDTVRVLEGVI